MVLGGRWCCSYTERTSKVLFPHSISTLGLTWGGGPCIPKVDHGCHAGGCHVLFPGLSSPIHCKQ